MAVTAEDNRQLTQTSAGTPMGELPRSYWWPIAADDQPPDDDTHARRCGCSARTSALYRDLGIA